MTVNITITGDMAVTLAGESCSAPDGPLGGIVSDGDTDQTSELISALAGLGAASFRGTVSIPKDTVFDVRAVFASVPQGIVLDIEDSHNWGQYPGYKSRHIVRYSSDDVDDDTTHVFASPHHASLALMNFGTAGTGSANNYYSSLWFGAGIDPFGDPLFGFVQQQQQDSGDPDHWHMTWRLQTPFEVATKVQPWVASTPFAVGDILVAPVCRKVYRVTVAGTTAGTEPSHSSGSAANGTATLQYVQATINIDGTKMRLTEDGSLYTYSVGENRFTMAAGGRQTYFSYHPSTHDLLWRDHSRNYTLQQVTTARGYHSAAPLSVWYHATTGAAPVVSTPGLFLTQAGATNVTNFLLPSGQTHGSVEVLFGDANSTLKYHSSILRLKGGVDVTPPVGAIMSFRKTPQFGDVWVEATRNF